MKTPNWENVPFGELVDIKYGKALRATERAERGSYPVYGSNGIVGYSDIALVQHPTIIIGRKGAVGEAHYSDTGCWPIDTAFYTSPRTAKKIDMRYLLLWLRSRDLKKLAITSTIPGINRDTLKKQLVPLPPLFDQHRIVRILDEADNLRKLRQEADKTTAELIPAIFYEIFGDSTRNEKGWKVVPFKNVVESTKLGLVRGAKEMNDALPYAYVRMDSIVGDGTLKLEPIKRVNASATEVKEFSLRGGDFLFNTRNSRELVGKTALFEGIGTYLFNNNIMRIRFNNLAEPRYMLALFQTDYLKRQLESCKSGTTSVVAIYYKSLQNISIVLPPESLQRKFAVRVAEVQAMEEKQAESRKKLDELFNSLLDRAFKGEL